MTIQSLLIFTGEIPINNIFYIGTAISVFFLMWQNSFASENYKAIVVYNEGLQKFEDGEFRGAIECFTEAVRLDNSLAVAYEKRGESLAAEGSVKKAIDDYTEVIRINPKHAMAFYKRGILRRHLSHLDAAIADFSQAIALKPIDVSTLFNDRGLTWSLKGDIPSAISDYTQAIKHDSQFSQAFHNRGVKYLQSGKLSPALDDFNESIRLNSSFSASYANRGLVFLYDGKIENAILDIDKAILLDPKNPMNHVNKAQCFTAKRQVNKALDCLNAAVECDSNNPAVLLIRGKLRAERTFFAQAIQDFDKVSRIAPDNPDAFAARAWIRATCNNPAIRNGRLALIDSMYACELSKWKNASHLTILAASYAELGNVAEAIKWQKKALEDAGYERIDGESARRRLKIYEERR